MNDLFPRLKTQLQNWELKETSLIVILALVCGLLGFVACYFLVPVKSVHNYFGNDNSAQMAEKLVMELIHRDAKQVATVADGISLGYFDSEKNFIPVFEQDAQKGRYSASLIKIPTMLTVLQTANLDDVLTIDKESNNIEGVGYKEGSTVSVRDLSAATMVASSNDAVDSLKKYYERNGANLLEQVKSLVASFPISSVVIGSLSGLDNENVKSFISSRDAIILAHIFAEKYPWLAHLTTLPSYTSEKTGETLLNTNPLVSSTSDIVFSKTGYTDAAGGNLVVLFNSCGRLWGVSVLADTFNGRFESVNSYIKTVNESCTLVQMATSEVSKKIAK